MQILRKIQVFHTTDCRGYRGKKRSCRSWREKWKEKENKKKTYLPFFLFCPSFFPFSLFLLSFFPYFFSFLFPSCCHCCLGVEQTAVKLIRWEPDVRSICENLHMATIITFFFLFTCAESTWTGQVMFSWLCMHGLFSLKNFMWLSAGALKAFVLLPLCGAHHDTFPKSMLSIWSAIPQNLKLQKSTHRFDWICHKRLKMFDSIMWTVDSDCRLPWFFWKI
jgi:hypothetical protein